MSQLPKVSVKAILIGILVDIAGTLTVGTIIGFVLGVALASQARSRTDFDTILTQSIQSPGFLIVSLIVGLGFTFLGGFVAARIAKYAALTHSGIVGATAVILGLLYLHKGYPLWYNAAAFLLTVPGALLGGFAAKN